MEHPQFAPGQAWTYRAPPGFEASRIVVGAVLSFASGDVVCCAVTRAPRRHADGSIDETTIPFLPLSATALAQSVLEPDGRAPVPGDFQSGLEHWQADDRGLSVFTVPFEGFLDHLIARQMAAILGIDAEEAVQERYSMS